MALGQGIPEEWLSYPLEAYSKPKLENVDRAIVIAIVQDATPYAFPSSYRQACFPCGAIPSPARRTGHGGIF